MVKNQRTNERKVIIMAEHLEGLMETAMRNIKAMVDVNTIVGDAVTTPDGTVIIPISTVSFGFGAGGSDFAPKKNSVTDGAQTPMFGGGAGSGANIKPVAFMVVSGGNVRLMPISNNTTPVEKIIDLIPEMIDKVNGVISGIKKDKQEEE